MNQDRPTVCHTTTTQVETNNSVVTNDAEKTQMFQHTPGITVTTIQRAATSGPPTTRTPTIEVRTVASTTMGHNTTMEMETVALEKPHTTMLEPTQLVDSHLININLTLPNSRCITHQS
jgi:hypothetical protein